MPTARFLTGQWRALVMMNFEIAPDLVAPLVPRGTEIDFHEGRTFVSLVGFMFRDTRVLGLSFPWWRHFEEVNLRFYVKRLVGDEVRRGVCFIRELVPSRMIAWTARRFYNEPYFAVPMSHAISGFDAAWNHGEQVAVQYGWQWEQAPYSLSVKAHGAPSSLHAGSLEEFIAEHYWGYCRQRNGGTVEYQVEHPPWRAWHVDEFEHAGDFARLYGVPWGEVLSRSPDSVFLAEGSAITVRKPRRIA